MPDQVPNKDPNRNNPPPKRPNLVPIFLGAALGFLLLSNLGSNKAQDPQKVPYSEFLDKIEKREVQNVTISSTTVKGEFVPAIPPQNPDNAKAPPGKPFYAVVPPNENVTNRLAHSGVKFEAEDESPSLFGKLIWLLLPIGLLGALMIYMMRGAGGGGVGAMTKSKAKLNAAPPDVKFEDVAGVDEAKEDLKEMVDFLKDPRKFSGLGAKIPKGALLVGPPGTGKTLLAKAVAGEAAVPFFSVAGSEFVEMYVGLGAARVRDLFSDAKKHAPCIIFIDEIDAVGQSRANNGGLGGHDERGQTLNQLLVEMDGFGGESGIIVLAATNRADTLDSALIRPGRFDRQISVDLPDLNGREKILQIHAAKVPLAKSVSLRTVAKGTPGFSGADLANLVNEAALLMARKGRKIVTMNDFENAKDKILMGAERRTLAMTEEEKKLTAYHEAGHALVAIMEQESDPIHKATIIPRGRALGMVVRLPEGDRISYSRAKLKADLAVAMAGRVAEEMIFGHAKVTTGASSDINMATNLATRMVMEWGMSDKIGPRRFSQKEREGYMGMMGGGSSTGISEQTAKLIDQEIDAILTDAYESAKKTMTIHKIGFERIAQALIEYETLSGEEIKAVAQGLPVIRLAEVAADQDNEDPGTSAVLPLPPPPTGGALPPPAPGP